MISRSVLMALIVVIAEIHLFPIPYAIRYDMGTMHTVHKVLGAIHSIRVSLCFMQGGGQTRSTLSNMAI
jgi:hypothetical protein